MVDLVKIRKKARKAAEESTGGEAHAPTERSGSGREGGVPAPTERSGTGREGGAQPEAEAPPLESEPLLTTPPPRSLPPGRDETTPPPSSLPPRRDVDSKIDRFKEEAGKRRGGFIAAEAVTATVEQLELLTSHIAGEQYALDIEHIVEIVHPRESTRVPNADESIVGIISLRGTIVTIVDVRRRLR